MFEPEELTAISYEYSKKQETLYRNSQNPATKPNVAMYETSQHGGKYFDHWLDEALGKVRNGKHCVWIPILFGINSAGMERLAKDPHMIAHLKRLVDNKMKFYAMKDMGQIDINGGIYTLTCEWVVFQGGSHRWLGADHCSCWNAWE
jgi:hypothetical protein